MLSMLSAASLTSVNTMLPTFPETILTLTNSIPSGSIVASAYAPGEAVIDVCEWASSNGALGLVAFAAAHTISVVVCFPATILFEIAAGFAFGIYQGAVLAWAAKVAAAAITFFASSGIARKVLSDAGVEEAAAAAFSSQPSLKRLAQNVEQEGARYTFLARLSPIPSWLNNYGLAFAGVRFVDYAPATAIATLPSVLTHVYAGSLLSSLRTFIASSNDNVYGGAGMNIPSTLAGSSLSGLSAVMGCLLLRELAKAVLTPSSEETLDVEKLEVKSERIKVSQRRRTLFNEENDNVQGRADPQNHKK
mmetsp:Transcript_33805/g.37996  ORF Transcript_33805/g.37996 Transcript_33805/m.37996 type:complete len:306 (+) Transcript_33805:152-1069(+)